MYVRTVRLESRSPLRLQMGKCPESLPEVDQGDT